MHIPSWACSQEAASLAILLQKPGYAGARLKGNQRGVPITKSLLVPVWTRMPLRSAGYRKPAKERPTSRRRETDTNPHTNRQGQTKVALEALDDAVDGVGPKLLGVILRRVQVNLS